MIRLESKLYITYLAPDLEPQKDSIIVSQSRPMTSFLVCGGYCGFAAKPLHLQVTFAGKHLFTAKHSPFRPPATRRAIHILGSGELSGGYVTIRTGEAPCQALSPSKQLPRRLASQPKMSSAERRGSSRRSERYASPRRFATSQY